MFASFFCKIIIRCIFGLSGAQIEFHNALVVAKIGFIESPQIRSYYYQLGKEFR
jgi:hypothetical protein